MEDFPTRFCLPQAILQLRQITQHLLTAKDFAIVFTVDIVGSVQAMSVKCQMYLVWWMKKNWIPYASLFLVEVLVGGHRWFIHSKIMFGGTVDLFCIPEMDKLRTGLGGRKKRTKYPDILISEICQL